VAPVISTSPDLSDDRRRCAERLDAARQAMCDRHVAEATRAYRAAIRLARRLGPTSPELRDSLTLLAYHYHHSRQHRQAVRTARRLLALQHQALGPAHADLVATYALLTQLYTGHRPTEATRFYRLELGIVEQVFGQDALEVARVCSNLAGHLYAYGHSTEAVRLWERALAILEQHRRRRPLPSAWLVIWTPTTSSLACCYGQLGRHADAERLYRRVLRHNLQRGRDHVRVAWTLVSLAREVHAQGRLTQAAALLERAATIQETWWAGREALVPLPARPGVSMMRMEVLRQQAAVLYALGRAGAAGAVEARIQQHQAKFGLIDSAT
jgi:tetratricopeptide (TPR) repeat protein